LQCVAVYCSVPQCIAVCTLRNAQILCVWVVALCCGVLHCVYTVAQAQNPVYMQTSVFLTKWHRVFMRSRIVHIHSHTHTHTSIHTHLHPYTCITHRRAHTHTHTYISSHSGARTHTHLNAQRPDEDMHCTHTHTHTHTHTRTE